ncbi:beta/gamma crystallin domain-containing protein [Streptomyces sp. NPDC056160]|uniref:beta/gamma crystallin domain-containing protein n=1 Tax=Streptomyces sp. NPDC056160 TaxID=3345731 RepID=UPI0035E1B3BB
MHQAVKRVFVVAMAAAGLAVASPAAPASAAELVSCGDPTLPPRNDFASLQTSTGNQICFANAGDVKVSYNDITGFHAGNNRVTFSYTIQENGYQHDLTLEKWQNQTLTFGMHAAVYNVHIY